MTVLDPICGMTVHVDRAESAGLTAVHDGRTYAFCGAGCLEAFVRDPARHVVTGALAGVGPGDGGRAGLPVIDEGMRRWYESCSCCLGDAYPEIKAQLDAERAAGAVHPLASGNGEVAPRATDGGSAMSERRTIAPNEDPVCGMTPDPASARARGLVHVHEGREYVFCGKGCMLEFRDNPEQYLAASHRPSM